EPALEQARTAAVHPGDREQVAARLLGADRGAEQQSIARRLQAVLRRTFARVESAPRTGPLQPVEQRVDLGLVERERLGERRVAQQAVEPRQVDPVDGRSDDL